MTAPLKLSLIIPVLNEEETVEPFVQSINRVLIGQTDIELELIFINDGSKDATLPKLITLSNGDPRIRILDLARNFGKEAALSAGLQAATGDIVAPIDVDLQDPPELLVEMIEKWKQGYEVVLGRRTDRDSDSWLKRFTAKHFYRINNKISPLHLPENVGDFRLMDRRVVDAVNALPESCRFMKGLFAWVGFKTTYVDYSRPPRVAGKSKFNGWKLWNFAIEGITSFSTLPLRFWTYLGIFVSLSSILYACAILLKVLFHGIDVPGYASLIVAVTFLGGIQLMGIGILGEYMGRAYLESKRRPVFIVRKVYAQEKEVNVPVEKNCSSISDT